MEPYGSLVEPCGALDPIQSTTGNGEQNLTSNVIDHKQLKSSQGGLRYRCAAQAHKGLQRAPQGSTGPQGTLGNLMILYIFQDF